MPDKERPSWGATSILIAAGAAAALLIWRSYHHDAPRITTYVAPPAREAPRAETARSLEASAESLFAAQRYNEAILAYRRMLDLDPTNASGYNDLGLALHYAGRSGEAARALEKATALDPRLQRAWLSYGFVLKSMGREAEAQAALKKTIALNPSTPQGVEARSMLKR